MAGIEAASMLGQPQPVEIHHRGIWYSGELIGWRHESNGRVAARVRCTVDGLRHSTWKDLADLRLPDPKRPPHKEPFPAVVKRPGPVVAEDPDEATRPHALLAAMRGSRPAKPDHAVMPPAPRPPAAPPAPLDLPPPGHSAERRPFGRPAAERPRRELDRRAAYLRAV
ncbi:MAG TPA: hypothetical protein VK402_20855 [Blastococcus sp.]|nr:hypothetical protein [Blastococcus sp.]